MSSMRNAVTRRPHRERAQPEARKKWGLLEKHKDYSLRAQDYNTKKKKLSQLTTKIRDRHPDEFAYGMLNKGSGKQGKHGRSGDENRLSHDAVKLLKTQDAGYLRVAAARGRKEMKKVNEQLGVAEGSTGQKIVFEDAAPQEDKRGKKRDSGGHVLEDVNMNEVAYPELPALGMNSDDEVENPEESDVPTSRAKAKKALHLEKDASARLRAERKRRRRLQEVRKVKLDMLKKRQQEILATADQLDLQRARMAKAIGGVNKTGVKFKLRERKR
ncbi:uncharacterized protein HMPREF1541_03730 [Cyphellophora europaea CBS 101466]|uniref:U3 small nucleolar RNA-associated protein 11 n=1 Tax=Cyphellophora europaea (strain CBS 101466) TaxID=1220924 RepID=W2S156_CYPE1|nr:uncharacterized protein HMPREF1541_03730 [Cyphellophora europaea CBS 101466]ETN41793.1 hypothetical protein HMPREF1541_03730 [Cyphellophora europaea CBS 101466]